MHAALSLLFCAALPVAPASLDNLDFGTGQLTGWQGEGFYLTTGSRQGPGPSFGVCSSDGDRPGRTGLLHRTFVVPPGVGTLHCTAYATPGPAGRADTNLNIFLEAARREVLPKLVRTADGFERCACLLPTLNGRPREYVWQVADRA